MPSRRRQADTFGSPTARRPSPPAVSTSRPVHHVSPTDAWLERPVPRPRAAKPCHGCSIRGQMLPRCDISVRCPRFRAVAGGGALKATASGNYISSP
jgi:hypothetical protein